MSEPLAIAQILAVWSHSQSLAPVLAHPAADPVLTLDQAATYSGLAAKTLKIDALAGKLSTIRRSEGGRFRVRLSDINTYIDTQRQAADRPGRANTTDDIDWSA